MKRTQWWLVAVNLVLLACSFVPTARAGDISVEERQKRDAVCTKCHDETESKPILAIYQTPHGVSADARTPSWAMEVTGFVSPQGMMYWK